MKTIILLLFISLSSIAQINNPTVYPIINANDSMSYMKSRSAGDELQKATSHFYGGFTLGCVGASVILVSKHISYSSNLRQEDIENSRILAGVGTIFALAGTCIILESVVHLKRAGIILNQNGVGLKINLNK